MHSATLRPVIVAGALNNVPRRCQQWRQGFQGRKGRIAVYVIGASEELMIARAHGDIGWRGNRKHIHCCRRTKVERLRNRMRRRRDISMAPQFSRAQSVRDTVSMVRPR